MSRFGSFGLCPGDVRRTEFYAFFHLTDVSEDQQADGGTALRFGTVGWKFRDHMSFVAEAGPDGQTRRLALTLTGTFITTAELSPFARDIAKSFIVDAASNNADIDQLAPLLHDIRIRPLEGVEERVVRSESGSSPEDLLTRIREAVDSGRHIAVTLGSGRPPGAADLQPVATRGFAVYAGARPTWSIDLTETRLTLSNAGDGDQRVLTIAFDAGA